jgi:hypothetical protein
MPATLPQLRLQVKRAFARYYMELCSPSIADPSEVTGALSAYFAARRRELGDLLYRLEFEDDVARLAGEIEQDLRMRHRGALVPCLQREPLDARFHECVGLLDGRLA